MASLPYHLRASVARRSLRDEKFWSPHFQVSSDARLTLVIYNDLILIHKIARRPYFDLAFVL
jgi:hypothetical protein